MTSSSGNECEQWWQVTPSRGSQEPGWVTVHSPILPQWLGRHLGTFSLLKYSWLLMLISAIQQSNPDIHLYVYSFPWWFITGYWIQLPVLYSRTLLFIHPSIHPSTQTFISPSKNLIIHLLIHPSAQTFVHLVKPIVVHLPAVHPFKQPLAQPSINPFIHSLIIQTSIHPNIHPFFQTSIHPSIHPSIQTFTIQASNHPPVHPSVQVNVYWLLTLARHGSSHGYIAEDR